MVKSFWSQANQVINQSDVLIEVLDARMVDETRNKEIEGKIKRKEKRIIYVINKCDLVKKGYLDKKKKDFNDVCIFVSTKEHLGTTMLKKKLIEFSNQFSGGDGDLRVGVLGYPNTGKSSIINVLKGKTAAPVSSVSGYTKALRLVRIHKNIVLIDTPGVFSFGETDEIKHALMAVKNPARIKDPDIAAMTIIDLFRENNPKKFFEFYDVEISKDTYETLENTAIKKNKLLKGGLPDIDGMARIIIKDWQSGNLNLVEKENYERDN